MLELFHKQIAEIEDAADLGLKFNYFLALQRGILQTAAICAIEYCKEFSPESVEPPLVEQMLNPSDGTPLAVLDSLIASIRQHGWTACATGWYPTGNSREPGLDPLVSLVEKWVAFRNNRPGHGVIDLRTINENRIRPGPRRHDPLNCKSLENPWRRLSPMRYPVPMVRLAHHARNL